MNVSIMKLLDYLNYLNT